MNEVNIKIGYVQHEVFRGQDLELPFVRTKNGLYLNVVSMAANLKLPHTHTVLALKSIELDTDPANGMPMEVIKENVRNKNALKICITQFLSEWLQELNLPTGEKLLLINQAGSPQFNLGYDFITPYAKELEIEQYVSKPTSDKFVPIKRTQSRFLPEEVKKSLADFTANLFVLKVTADYLSGT